MIYGTVTDHIGFAIVCEKMGISIEWDIEKNVGGVFKREYRDDRRYTMKKLADITDRENAEELKNLLKYIVDFVAEEWRSRYER